MSFGSSKYHPSGPLTKSSGRDALAGTAVVTVSVCSSGDSVAALTSALAGRAAKVASTRPASPALGEAAKSASIGMQMSRQTPNAMSALTSETGCLPSGRRVKPIAIRPS